MLERRFVLADDQLEVPFLHQAIAVFDHARDLVGGIHMDQREGDVPEERLARQPEQDRGILADAPQHRQTFKLVIRLAQDVDALILQFVQRLNHILGI